MGFNLLTFIAKYKYIFIAGVVIIMIISVTLAALPNYVQFPFSVTNTSPASDEQNVYPGEITIVMNTSSKILTPKSFQLEFSPPLSYPYEPIANFPTKEVQVRVLGGLLKNTEYTVSMKDGNGNLVHNWKFKTSGQEPENSSALVAAEEGELIKREYPLIYDVPYSTTSFDIYYTGGNKLEVKVKPGVDKNIVKQEVEAFIRSKGVDPATHTIEYK